MLAGANIESLVDRQINRACRVVPEEEREACYKDILSRVEEDFDRFCPPTDAGMNCPQKGWEQLGRFIRGEADRMLKDSLPDAGKPARPDAWPKEKQERKADVGVERKSRRRGGREEPKPKPKVETKRLDAGIPDQGAVRVKGPDAGTAAAGRSEPLPPPAPAPQPSWLERNWPILAVAAAAAVGLVWLALRRRPPEVSAPAGKEAPPARHPPALIVEEAPEDPTIEIVPTDSMIVSPKDVAAHLNDWRLDNFPRVDLPQDAVHAAVELGIQEVWRAEKTRAPLAAAILVVEEAIKDKAGTRTPAKEISVALTAEDLIRATERNILGGTPIQHALKRNLLRASDGEPFAESMVLRRTESGNLDIGVGEVSPKYFEGEVQDRPDLQKFSDLERFLVRKALADVWNDEAGIRAHFKTPGPEYVEAVLARLGLLDDSMKGMPVFEHMPQESKTASMLDEISQRIRAEKTAAEILEHRAVAAAENVNARDKQNRSLNPSAIARQIEKSRGGWETSSKSLALAERIHREVSALSFEKLLERFRTAFGNGGSGREIEIPPGELPSDLLNERLVLISTDKFDALTVRANLAGHTEFDSLGPADKQRACEGIAEYMNSRSQSVRQAFLKPDGWRFREEKIESLIRAHGRSRIATPAKGRGGPGEGGGPSEPPSRPTPPTQAAKGGGTAGPEEVKGEFVDPFADDPGFSRSERRITLLRPRYNRVVLEHFGGHAALTGILGTAQIAEKEGWISPSQTRIFHAFLTGAFFAADAGFVVTAAGGAPGATVGALGLGYASAQIGQVAGLKTLRYGGNGNILVTTAGGVAGFGVSLKAANHFARYRGWHSAGAEGTRYLARSVLSRIGAAQEVVKNGLPAAWRNFSTGVWMYGREVAAVASGYAAAIQTGAGVFFNVAGRLAGRLAFPVFIVGDLDDYMYMPDRQGGQNNQI